MDWMNFTNYFSALIFVLGLILALGWGARYLFFSGKAFASSTKNQKITIEEVRPLDTRRRLMRVSWDDEELLILLGPQSEQIIRKEIIRDQDEK